jgi:LysM repeat protein
MGELTNNGNGDPERVDWNQAILQHTWAPSSTNTPFRWNNPGGYTGAQMGADGYDPLNATGQGMSGTDSRYQVRSGDTLSGIAQAVWGDASLWYVLAQANGLSGDGGLVAGQSLVVPDKVVSNTNNASTYRPYDAAHATGDLSPTTAKPPKKPNCIVVIIAAIVAAVATHFLGPIGGNLVSQGFNNLVGLQDGFSVKSLAVSYLTHQLSPPGTGNFLKDVVQGAVTNFTVQSVLVATRLQKDYDWVGVAAAGVSAGVSGQFGAKFEDSVGKFGASVIRTTASGIAGAATVSLVTGRDFGDTLLSQLPTIIGQAAGAGINSQIKGPDMSGASEDGDSPSTGLLGGVFQFARSAIAAVGRFVGGGGTVGGNGLNNSQIDDLKYAISSELAVARYAGQTRAALAEIGNIELPRTQIDTRALVPMTHTNRSKDQSRPVVRRSAAGIADQGVGKDNLVQISGSRSNLTLCLADCAEGPTLLLEVASRLDDRDLQYKLLTISGVERERVPYALADQSLSGTRNGTNGSNDATDRAYSIAHKWRVYSNDPIDGPVFREAADILEARLAGAGIYPSLPDVVATKVQIDRANTWGSMIQDNLPLIYNTSVSAFTGFVYMTSGSQDFKERSGRYGVLAWQNLKDNTVATYHAAEDLATTLSPSMQVGAALDPNIRQHYNAASDRTWARGKSIAMSPFAAAGIAAEGFAELHDRSVLGQKLPGNYTTSTAKFVAGSAGVAATALPFTRAAGFGRAGTVVTERGAFSGAYATNGELVQSIATRADNWGIRQGLHPVNGRSGTLQHRYAENLLNRYRDIFAPRGLTAEARYINGQPWVAGSTKGSIRLDVIEGPLNRPTTVWDYKFGGATLPPSRVTQIQNGIPNGANVPVLEIKP